MSSWIDNETGLTWQIRSPGKMSWEKAMEHVRSIGNNWRLPTIEELRTLLDRSKEGSTVPFKDSLSYWSSTVDDFSKDFAWIMDFESGLVDDCEKSGRHYVRCVRDEQ